MPDCEYCSSSFDDEESYYAHLGEEHADELGPIDRRRIEQHTGGSDDEGLPTGPLILVGVIVFALAVVAFVIVFMGSGSGAGEAGPPATINGINVSTTPTGVGSVHTHGTINVTIDGQTLDFTRDRFLRYQTYDAFHFENPQGPPNWHVHARHVTLEYAMATIGIEATDDSISYNGKTYRDSESGTTVEVLVNGEDVDPSTYTLDGAEKARNGDHVRLFVATNESA